MAASEGNEKGQFSLSVWRAWHSEEKGYEGGRGVLEECSKVTEG